MRIEFAISASLCAALIVPWGSHPDWLGDRAESSIPIAHTEHLPELWFEENSVNYLHDTARYQSNNQELTGPNDVLAYIAKLMTTDSSAIFEVHGSADATEANVDSLAMARAKKVCKDLSARGVKTDRLRAVSLGSRNPRIKETGIAMLSAAEERHAARTFNRNVSFYFKDRTGKP